jgi:LysM repeat protein
VVPAEPAVQVAPEAPATATLPTRSNVTIDTIAYDASAEVELTGRAGAGDFVRVYLDNGLQAEVAVSPEGRWRARLTDVAPGIYTLRVDEVSGDGAVTSRFETPFKREDPALLAARGAVTPAPEATPVAEATPETPAPGAAPDSGTVEVAAAEPQPEAPQPPPTATPAPTPAVEAPPAEAPAPEPVETAAADPVVVDTTPAPDPAPEAAPVAAETPVPDTATPAPVPEVAAADAPAPAAEPVASAEVAPAPAPRPAAQVITVQPGFTLWGIAQDMMGQGEMYVQVYEANKDQIRDPDLIYPGQVFTLPGQN